MNRTALGAGVVIVVAMIVGQDAFLPRTDAQNPQPGDRGGVSPAVQHDTSPPLRSMPFRPPAAGFPRKVPLRVPAGLASRPDPDGDDPAAQTAPGVSSAVQLQSFEGLSDDDNAAVLGFRVVPPDPNGDVGPNHYVQMINLILAVYDKSTGARILGPLPGNSIFTGFGGPCETENDGDPIVLYDHLADRWLLSQFAVDAGAMCIAVSAGSDPTGSYHRYAFAVSPAGAYPDYPKLGVWPDGYYMSANEFTASGFAGAIAVAFERDQMLVGGPARMVRRGPLPCGTECYFSLQPSDLDGPAPALGTPNTYITAWDDETWGTGAGADGYRMFAFGVDWGAPASSTFTQLPMVLAPEFDANLCRFNRACIPQRSPGERLDALSAFTMYRAQYRTFDGYVTLVLNHTVDVARDRAGIRWVELRQSGGGWSIAQTGTYAPDSNHRWVGSIAMDKAGNLALGYSVSGRSDFPSIRYTTHDAAFDPPGAMGSEVVLQTGSGVQRNSANRWGDYSAMSVDPVDGCTFWYTQEYYANTGSFDFKTRFGSFKIPSCF